MITITHLKTGKEPTPASPEYQIYAYLTYKGWNFNSGNYLFTTDTK